MGSLQNKNLIIAGGTSGMGLSAARAFIKEGANLLLIGRDADKIDQLRKEMGDKSLFLQGDISEEAVATEMIRLARSNWATIDGLYHVAGGSGRKWGDGPVHSITMEGWEKTLQLNLTSVMLTNRAVLNYWLENERGGSILNMSSVLGYSPSPEFFSTHTYAAAKAAIIGFSRSAAAYYAKNNIRVNVIAPALVETPMAQRAAGNEAIMAFIKEKQPLDGGRIGRPEDLDGLATFFMSDSSAFVTGQVVGVDGGWDLA